MFRVLLFVSIGLGLVFWGAWWLSPSEGGAIQYAKRIELKRIEKLSQKRSEISRQLGPLFLEKKFPLESEILWEGTPTLVQLRYTFDQKLQQESDHLLSSFKPDYGAIVVLDPVTGRTLAMSSFQREGVEEIHLALSANYPAASIFKIITATAALDKYQISPETLVMYNGGNHTLYRKNVLYSQMTPWSRAITLKEAFARSINTVFGRLVFESMEPTDIEEYSIRFGFNKPIQSDLPIDTSFAEIPREKNFQLAEIVSGYNRVTRMSPFQGAMIAASVAAHGVMRVPYIVDKMNTPRGEPLFTGEPVTASVTMSGSGAEKLKILMQETIQSGTSRKSFQPLLKEMKRNRITDLELGGKTGSLHGDQPKGKVDWFVGYAISEDHGSLAVAAVTVNKEKWTVKSSFLAQSLIKKYFGP